MALVLSLLRVIHVFSAFIWAGVVIVNYAWLAPAVKASGPAGGAVMQRIATGSLPRVMSIAPLLTVLAGFCLFWVYSGHLNMDYFRSWKGIALTIGALAGLAAFFEGMFLSGPTSGKMRKLGAEIQASGGPPTPEQMATMQTLQARLASASGRSAIFLSVALVGMSLGAS